jgi:hypothetical protein
MACLENSAKALMSDAKQTLVDVKTVSAQAGYASAAFTLDNYAHVLSTMKQGASDKLENLLRPL